MLATGIEHVILSESDTPLPSQERWLLCGAVALCFLALSAIHYTTVKSGSIRCSQRQVNYRFGAVVAIIALAVMFTSLLPVVLLGLLAIIGVAQVLLDLYTRWSNIKSE